MKRSNIFLITILACLLAAGCEETLEKDIAGQKVNLLAPANNLITADTIHTFFWDNLDGANQYRLQIVSPRFDSIVKLIIDTPINRNTFMIDLNLNRYQWRVRASNSAFTSAFSDTWNLKIQ